MLKKKKYSLLYIEDEPIVREMVIDYLEEFFSEIFIAIDGNEGLDLYHEMKPDMIITDIEMPNMNGLEFISLIRKFDELIPIIITTAYSDTKYLLHAVELNLVKFILKPIEESIILESLERCYAKIESKVSNIISLSSTCKYDTFNYTLVQNNEIISLTASQSKLLELLIRNRDRVVSYLEIENYIWEYKGMSDAAIRSLVHDIRKIIHKDIILNISKIGYKINLN